MESDPIIGILLTNFKHKPQMASQYFVSLIESQKYAFPDISQTNINSYLKTHDSDIDYQECLQKLGFKFVIDHEMLRKITQLTTENKNDQNFIAKFILYSFVEWNRQPDISTLPDIIKALLFMLPTDYSDLTVRAIEYSFKYYLATDHSTYFDEFYHVFLYYFTKYPKYATQSQEIIPMYFSFIYKSLFSLDDDLPKQLDLFMHFLFDIYTKTPEIVTQETTTNLICQMTDYLISLDDLGLQFLEIVTPHYSEVSATSLSMLFPDSIIRLIEHEPPRNIFKNVDGVTFNGLREIEKLEHIVLPIFSPNIQGRYAFVSRKTYEKGFAIQSALNLADSSPLESLIPGYITHKLKIIIKAVSKYKQSQEKLFEIFAQKVAESQGNDYFFDIVAVFVMIFHELQNQDFILPFWRTLFDTYLFDDRVNAVDPNDDFVIIEQYRALIFNELKINNFSSFAHIIHSFTTKPVLFAETMHRVLVFFPLISHKTLSESLLIKTISTVSVYFQTVHFTCNVSLIPLVEATRSIIFLFIQKIFETPELTLNWFRHHVFSSSFFSFLFELPIRPFVLLMLKTYLVNSQWHVHYDIFEGIINLCFLAFDQIPNDDYLRLSCDVLHHLNEFLNHKQLSQSFVDLVNPMIVALNNLKPSDLSNDFLVNAIHFCAVLSEEQSLTKIQLSIIEHAVETVQGNEPSSLVFTKFVQILAGMPLSGIQPAFIIKQPLALSPLVHMYQQSEQFMEKLQFLFELIQFTYFNSIAANEVGFEADLLDIINQMKALSDEKSKQLIEYIFEIVSHICMKTSSTQVIQKFISLIQPVDGKYLSDYHPFFIRNLTDIIVETKKMPTAWLPINGNYLHVSLHNFMFNNDFEDYMFLFWIYIDQPASKAHSQIFRITDKKDRGFCCFISSGCLMLINLNKYVESTARIETPLPAHQWIPIILQIRHENGKTFTQTVINHTVSRKLEFRWPGFKIGPLEITLGKSTDIEESPPVFMANFGVYPSYTQDDISILGEIGPRECESLVTKPYAFVNMVDEHGVLKVEWSGPFTALLEGGSVSCSTTFCDILISSKMSHIFLPMFSHLDLPKQDGQYIDKIADISLELIITILQISPEIQQNFDHHHGFEILSHLLLVANAFVPTINTYTRFYTLLQSVTDPKVQKSIIKNILVDFSFFKMYNTQMQLRIAKQWSRVLLNSYYSILIEIYPLKTWFGFLASIIEIEQQDYVLNAIADNVMHIIMKMIHDQMAEEDYSLIISFGLKKNQFTQIVRINRCFDIMTVLLTECVDKLKELPEEVIKQLLAWDVFLNLGDFRILIRFLEIIIAFHKQGLLQSLTFAQHVEMIIRHIPITYSTNDVVSSIAEIANDGNYELLPLVCYLGLHAGTDAIFSIFRIVEPNPLSLASKFWISVLAVKSSGDIRSQVLRFINKCSHEPSWQETTNILECVCYAMKEDVGTMIHEYLMIIATELLAAQTVDHKNYNLFYSLASNTIFYHNNTISSALEGLYLNSPFYQQTGSPKHPSSSILVDDDNSLYNNLRSRSMIMRKLIDHDDCSICRSMSFARRPSDNGLAHVSSESSFLFLDNEDPTFSPMKFYSDIKSYSKKSNQKTFNLRTDRNGDWLDRDLAVMCIRLFTRFINPLYLYFDLVLCAFVVRYDFIEVERHLYSLKLVPAQIRANIQLIGLLIKKAPSKLKIDWLKEENIEETPGTLEEVANKKSNLFEPLARKIAQDFTKINQDVDDLIDLNDEMLDNAKLDFADEAQRHFPCQVRADSDSKMMQWTRLWEEMTFELAPWESPSNQHSHNVYFRDSLLCTNLLIPLKMKRKLFMDGETKQPSNFDIPQNALKCTKYDLYKSKTIILDIKKNCLFLFTDKSVHKIEGSSIKYLIERERNDKNALEIVLTNGKTYSLIFIDVKLKHVKREIEQIATNLEPIHMITTTQWENREVSTFAYLLSLNRQANRSFSDIYEYPAFPSLFQNVIHQISFDLPKNNYTFDASFFLSHYVESPHGSFKNISQLEDQNQVIPEFYFFPELLNRMELPPWAENSIDFVYKSRKALESEECDKMLPKWIDFTFGVDQPEQHSITGPSEIPFKKIFHAPHPLRIAKSQPNLLKAPFSIETEFTGIVSGIVESATIKFLKFSFITRQGKMRNAVFDLSKNMQIISTTASKTFDMTYLEEKHKVLDSIAFFGNSQFATVNQKNGMMLFVDTAGESKFVPPFGMAKSFSASGKWFAMVCTDLITRIWNITDLTYPVHSIQSYRAETVCAAVSEPLQIFVSGTSDGSLQICSLTTGTVQKVIHIGKNNIPTHVMITNSWGFIVISTESYVDQKTVHELFLYTVNGAFIRSTKIPDRITAWHSWTDKSGFEYIAIALSNSKLYAFELYYMDLGHPIQRIHSAKLIVSLQFIPEMSALASITKNGIITLSPFVY